MLCDDFATKTFMVVPQLKLRDDENLIRLWRKDFLSAAGLGFEPRYPPPKGGVLPLDDPAMDFKLLSPLLFSLLQNYPAKCLPPQAPTAVVETPCDNSSSRRQSMISSCVLVAAPMPLRHVPLRTVVQHLSCRM